MFKLDLDKRLTLWSSLRKTVDTSNEPLQLIIDFWASTPISYGKPVLDPYYQASWITPWEIIANNRYDDFSKAVMIGYTLLLTEKFKSSTIEIRTLIDNKNNRLYNIVIIDNEWVLNFKDHIVVTLQEIPEYCKIENMLVLQNTW